MENKKFYLDSSTIRAVLTAVLPVLILIARAFGVDIGESEVQQAIEAAVTAASSLTLVYALVKIWLGRFKARQPLSYSRPPEPEGNANPQ